MNKKFLFLLAAGVLALGIFILSGVLKDDYKSPGPPQESARQEPSSGKTSEPGRYVDYSEQIIASTPGTKILFFHASWCPQCRQLESSIKSSVIPAGVTIIKVDYDSNQKLRQKYGVTLQTTLVRVDDAGNLVEKFVAYTKPTFEAVKENLL